MIAVQAHRRMVAPPAGFRRCAGSAPGTIVQERADQSFRAMGPSSRRPTSGTNLGGQLESPSRGTDAHEEAERRPVPVGVAVRRIDNFQWRHPVLGFPYEVADKFGNDQVGRKAALIAYYGLFALFPLLMLFTTVLGRIAHDNQKLQNELVDSALANFPIIGPQLTPQVHGLTESTAEIVVGSVLLVYGALGLGLATQRGINDVWNIPYVRRPTVVMRYVRGVGILDLLALSVVGVTALTGFATLASHAWVSTALSLVGSLATNFVLISFALMLMTGDKVKWRDLVLGAALATVFWQALQVIGTWYIGRQLEHRNEIYGFFGTVIVLLAWIYLGATLFLVATEINVVQKDRLWPRAMSRPPLTAADEEVFERLPRMEIRRPKIQLEIWFSPEADADFLELPTPSPAADPGE